MNGNLCAGLDQIWIYIFTNDFIIFVVALRRFPYRIHDCLVVQFFEDAVAAENYKIIVVLYFETFYVGCGDDAHGIASVPRIFRLNVTKRSRHRQSARKDSMRAYYHLDAGGVVRRRVRNVALILIYLATILLNATRFLLILRLVILRKEQYLFSSVDGHDGPTVADICDVTDVSDD